MKKILLIPVIFFCFTLTVSGQYLNGKPLSELDADYIWVVATGKPSKSADYTANINYGQVGGIRQAKKAYVYTDETGTEEAKFNGVEGIINVLAGLNYELVQAIPIVGVYKYILKKKR